MIDISYIEILVLVVVGVIAGTINVLAGGGSMLSMPVMIFFGLPSTIANGTNRIAILAQNIVATWVNLKSGYRNFGLSFSLAMCTLPGAYFGAYWGATMNADYLNYILAGVMLVSLLLMQIETKEYRQQAIDRKSLIWGHLIMPIIGFYGGFIQVGIGFILMPVLYRIMHLPLVEVNICKVFLVLFYTLVAIFVFQTHIEIMWQVGIALAAGNALGGYIGANLNIKKGNPVIKYAFNIVIIIFIIQLLFQTS